MKRPTIKDISAIVGVSPSTVSRALKDHPDISVAIKEEIKKVADLIKYHPNQMAANLRKNKSNLIGLIIPEISMFFFPSVIKGIEEIIRQEGYQLLVLQSNDNLEREKLNLQICSDQSIDGLLISLSTESRNVDHIEEFHDLGIPVVLFDKCANNTFYDEVLINDEDAVYQCVSVLYKNGCRNIAGMFGNELLSITQYRLKGFYKALEDFGFNKENIPVGFATNLLEAKNVATSLMDKHKIDGFFFMSDEVLAGLMPAIKSKKLIVPNEMKVIGISDGMLPFILDPPISHYHHDGFEMGASAAYRLMELLKNIKPESRTLKIKGELRLLKSC